MDQQSKIVMFITTYQISKYTLNNNAYTERKIYLNLFRTKKNYISFTA